MRAAPSTPPRRERSSAVAVQTAASSSAHLTKYSNITDLAAAQKKPIVDEAIVPVQPVFEDAVTGGALADLTTDGAMDGIAHAVEVVYGATGLPNYEHLKAVAQKGICLGVNHLPQALRDSQIPQARRGLDLATDLGGYVIMLGGANGAHLTSFSLVDALSHGRACAIMNPYYRVFFAPAILDSIDIAEVLVQIANLDCVFVPHLGSLHSNGRPTLTMAIQQLRHIHLVLAHFSGTGKLARRALTSGRLMATGRDQTLWRRRLWPGDRGVSGC